MRKRSRGDAGPTRMKRNRSKDAPDVAFHPPILVAALALTGWMLWREAPVAFLPAVAARPLGGLLGTASFVLFSWAALALHRAGTNIPTNLSATALVTSGPYRFSRNPIYLGLALGFVAMAAWLNSAWFLIMAVLFVGMITAGVIVREERYLRVSFGADYERYRASVRRWL